jgi:ferritin
MSIYLHGNDMLNASKYFFDESNEEHDHANKIYGYMFDMNCTPVVPKNVLDVRVEFTDVRDVIATSLAHEIVLSNAWNNIANVAKQEGDNATLSFALSFVNEQIEEENKFRDILSKIDSGMPNWELDTQFK